MTHRSSETIETAGQEARKAVGALVTEGAVRGALSSMIFTSLLRNERDRLTKRAKVLTIGVTHAGSALGK